MIQLTTRLVLELAKVLAWTRPLEPYPGWHFGIDEEPAPKGKVKLRLAIWDYCNRRMLNTPIRMEWYLGLRVNMFLGNDMSRCLFVGGCLEPNEFFAVKNLIEPGSVFIDIGANEGLYTLFASKLAGTVISVEPSHREYDRLQANLQLNGPTNVRTRQLALSDHSGQCDLQIAAYEHEGQNTFGDFSYVGIQASHTEKVELKRLDDLVAEEGLARVDVIKMDIEGAEFSVLKGAEHTLSTLRPALLLELSDTALHHQGSSANEVLSLLRSLGYEIYTFDKVSGKPTKAKVGDELSDNIVAAHPDRRWRGLDVSQ